MVLKPILKITAARRWRRVSSGNSLLVSAPRTAECDPPNIMCCASAGCLPFWSSAVFSPIQSKLNWLLHPAIGSRSPNRSPPESLSNGNSHSLRSFRVIGPGVWCTRTRNIEKSPIRNGLLPLRPLFQSPKRADLWFALQLQSQTLEVNEHEIALSASDFAHLHRALLWLLILFGVAAATSLMINVPTPLFAGMQCYLSWCAIAALIQYFFLRIRGSASSVHDSDRSITARRNKPNAPRR